MDKEVVRKYKTLLKSDVTSFLVSFRRKYRVFPIKLLNELSRNSSYKNLKKLIINGVSIEPVVLVKDINKKYRQLGKQLNPSHFNPTLRSYTKDAIKCSDEKEVKIIYRNYLDELKRQFNDMEMDLGYCLEGLKAINRALKLQKSEDKEKDNE